MCVCLASFSLRMGQFSDPVATHLRTNEVEMIPPPPGTTEGRKYTDSVFDFQLFLQLGSVHF